MRRPKTRTRKKQRTATRAPPRVENPAWLRESPDGTAPKPPVRTRADLVLPFSELTPQNFERLCVRLAERGARVVATWAYGKSGHAQHGIDVLVRMTDGGFRVWQCKRHKSIKKAEIEAAVRHFLARKWGQDAARFVLAVGCEFSSPAVVEAVEAARTKLLRRNIAFEAIDASQLTQQLKTEPELVDDFFGRPWAEALCPPEALERLKHRLSRFDVAALKAALRSCYNSWISTVDPGLPIVGQDAQGRTRASIPISDRYIQPDLQFQLTEPEVLQQSGETTAAAETRRNDAAESGQREREPTVLNQPRPRTVVRERRVGFDEYLGTRSQSLILGDAGSGKSSLLRFLALDLLSDRPVLRVTQARFKGLLPVWLPFALWVRMTAQRHAPVPIEEVAGEFLRLQGDVGLAEEIQRAVAAKTVVLLVDGLDEASDPDAAQTLLAVLTAFVERNGIPVVATSRPHGARNLTGLGGSWEQSSLAPLSDNQRLALASLWFGALERFEAGAEADNAQLAARAQRRATAFVGALQQNAAIARLSQTALFLLSFITLHSRGQNLPRSRFAAAREIVAQLMEHQPRRRDVSALSIQAASSEPRLRDRVIADFAFALQSGDLRGSIPDAAAEEDAVARGARLIVQRQERRDDESARAAAQAIFSFTEERAGLLVNKAPGSVGFLHLSLQEYLAAQHLMQLSVQEKIDFIGAHATRLRWHEPILYLLSLTANETELGQCLEAIERAPAANVEAEVTREALLTGAVFADFAHELAIVRRIAEKQFREVEMTAWGARQRHLLEAVIDGLFSESLSGACRAKLSTWAPDRHGYERAAAIRAVPGWDAPLKTAAIPALIRCLRCENEYIWREAAQVLPILADRSGDLKEELLRLARHAPTVQTAQAAIFSVGFGWTSDQDVGGIAEVLRANSHHGLCLDAVQIRAHRGETDKTDLDRFFSIAYSRERFSNAFFARDLAEHFAEHHRDAFAEKLEGAVAALSGDRIGRVMPLIGSLFLCDSRNATAHRELLGALSHDWILHDMFARGNFPVDRVSWTDELTAKVVANIRGKERYGENDLYWISKVLPLPLLKERFLEALRNREHLSFWCARGLVEGWGKADPEVQALFQSMLDAEPEALAEVGEELPLVIGDRTACREALLRGLRANVRCDFLLRGLKNLGITADDEEVVGAALEAGRRASSPLYRDLWCAALIDAFASHRDVRTIALDELLRRDGSLGAVARNYREDQDMCERVLGVLCPLDEGARMLIVRALEAAAPSSQVAFDLLGTARRDTDGSACGESIMGWVEAALDRGPIPAEEIQWLEDELHTSGPEHQKRAAAAAIGLLLAGHIERFVRAKRYDGKPLDVSVNPDLTKDDLYVRRLLPRWPDLVRTLGGEKEIFERFGIDPERSLQSVHAGVPNADRLFALLMEQVPTARHVHNSDLIGILAEFEPRGKTLRDLIGSIILSPFGGRTVGNHWAELRAAEVFAEYFRGDLDLRRQVMDAFKSNPDNGRAAAALAELLLREEDSGLASLLVEEVRGRHYGIGTHFKLMAALAAPDVFIELIAEFLGKDIDPDSWSLPYWMPTLVRRVKLDGELQAKMQASAIGANSISLKVTLLAMLFRAVGPRNGLSQYATDELRRLQHALVPGIGFDLASHSHRPLFHVLTELAA